jgi:DNA-binding LytR/AlgR family response regulator
MEFVERKIRCLIIDDEQPAHEVLKYLIGKVPWLEYLGSCYNAIDAMEVIAELSPDILFLDVSMPELSGVELLNIMQVSQSHVIMTTAYPEFAIDGFKYDVTAFLLKPIGFDRFLKAVTKVRRLQHPETAPAKETRVAYEAAKTFIPQLAAEAAGALPEDGSLIAEDEPLPPSTDEYIWVRADRKVFCIWFKDMYFVEGLKDYVKLYHKGGMLVTHGSVSSMEARLPKPQFVRTHRSFIVNRDAIKLIDGNTIHLNNNMQAAIAASQNREAVLKQLMGRRG